MTFPLKLSLENEEEYKFLKTDLMIYGAQYSEDQNVGKLEEGKDSRLQIISFNPSGRIIY